MYFINSTQVPPLSKGLADHTHSATPSNRTSSVDLARNGGIPVFVQERIEERLRRRSEVDIARSPDPEPEEGVVGVGGVESSLMRRSLSVFSGGCCEGPISITSVAIQAAPPSRPSSRMGTRVLLPQMPRPPEPGGAFASHYVANHLVEESNTKTLSNLSRLFKQQRPLNRPHQQVLCNAQYTLYMNMAVSVYRILSNYRTALFLDFMNWNLN